MSLTRVTIGSFLVGIAITCLGFAASKYPIPWAPWLYLVAYPVGAALFLGGVSLLGLALFDKWKYIANGRPPDIYFDAANMPGLMPGAHPPNRVAVLALREGNKWDSLMYMTGTALRPNTSGIRCVVQNEGEAAITDVSLRLHLTFREARQDDPSTPNTKSSGDVTSTKAVDVPISRLEPGSGGRFEFWLMNQADRFVEVTPHDRYAFERRDSEKPGKGRVTWRTRLRIVAYPD
jgi:hypothetical protein